MRLERNEGEYSTSPAFATDATGRSWFFDVPRRALVVTAQADGLFHPGAAELKTRGGGVLDPKSPLVTAASAARPFERDVTLARADDDGRAKPRRRPSRARNRTEGC